MRLLLPSCALLAGALLACTSVSTRQEIRAAEDAHEVKARATRAPGATDIKVPGADDPMFKRPALADLENAALLRNPDLVAAAHRVQALVERARAEGKPPSPELMSEIRQVPFAKPYALDKAGMIMFSVRQSIPAAGSLDRMAEATALEAQAEAKKLAAEARTLVREVDRAFADYVEASARHAAHMAHRATLDQMAQAARARYTAQGSLADVTRAELERARVDAEMERERGMVMVAQARLNGLLARPADAPLGEPDAREAMTAALAPAEAAALARAHPEVGAAELMEKSARASAEAADREANVPSFGVSFDTYLPVGGMPAGYGTQFSMSLPWLWGAGSSRAKSAEHRALAERATAEGTRLRAQADAVGALAAVRAAERRQLVLTRLAQPAARRAMEATQASYVTGGADILAWLDAARSALDVEMDLAGARGDLDRALADLDFAAGDHVARVPLASSKEQLHHE